MSPRQNGGGSKSLRTGFKDSDWLALEADKNEFVHSPATAAYFSVNEQKLDYIAIFL